MKAHTKESQAAMTPETSLQALKDGNERFINATQVVRDLNAQVAATSTGQYPFATVLHCIDSRVSAEHVFDQGIGDLFSIRIAGNFVNEDILGTNHSQISQRCLRHNSKISVSSPQTSNHAIQVSPCTQLELAVKQTHSNRALQYEHRNQLAGRVLFPLRHDFLKPCQ